MKGKLVKLQRRPHAAAVSLPVSMVREFDNDVEYLEARQYWNGKITLWPVKDVK